MLVGNVQPRLRRGQARRDMASLAKRWEQMSDESFCGSSQAGPVQLGTLILAFAPVQTRLAIVDHNVPDVISLEEE